jgi:hypothetical protein
MVLSWGYFIYTGQINTIWPMFGVANQLLASVALAVCTSILINQGRVKYAWVTVLPLLFLGTNTLYGGYLNITGNYYPLGDWRQCRTAYRGVDSDDLHDHHDGARRHRAGRRGPEVVLRTQRRTRTRHRGNSVSLIDAVRVFADGVRRLFQELYRTPPGC